MTNNNFWKICLPALRSDSRYYITVGLLLCGCTLDSQADDSEWLSPLSTGGSQPDESGATGGLPAAGSGASGGAPTAGSGSSAGDTGEGGNASGGTLASTGGHSNTGGTVGAGGSVATGGTASDQPTEVRVMSLNVYGYATMPAAAPTYASLVMSQDIDVLGIQEGVEDWQIQGLPTDYSRANAMGAALGDCWEQSYQVFVNKCRGVKLVSHERFDMSDGPNAARTGEKAVAEKDGKLFTFVDVHWDHEAKSTRVANANETATAVNSSPHQAVIVVGDFNSGCSAEEANLMSTQGDLSLIFDGGIDCIFARSLSGTGITVNASPSDHPGLVATLKL